MEEQGYLGRGQEEIAYGGKRGKSSCSGPTQGGWGREWDLRQDLRVVGGLSLTLPSGAALSSVQFSHSVVSNSL